MGFVNKSEDKSKKYSKFAENTNNNNNNNNNNPLNYNSVPLNTYNQPLYYKDY